jgi:hypothetical protein
MRSASLALIVALAGCAGADAATAPQAPSPVPVAAQQVELGLHPGEAMAFEVQLAGVLVGEAQLAVGEIGSVEGKRALVVQSRAATAGAAALVRKIVDEATTVIEADTGNPISVETNVEMGAKKTVASATFLPAHAVVKFQRNEDKQPSTFNVAYRGQRLHDAHSAMAQLRGWKAAPGTLRSVYVIGGRRLWRVDVKYVGEETIGSAVGNRRAVVYEGVSYRAKRDLAPETNKPARTFRVWLSDDADRVPLKVVANTELGEVIMSLTEYTRPYTYSSPQPSESRFARSLAPLLLLGASSRCLIVPETAVASLAVIGRRPGGSGSSSTVSVSVCELVSVTVSVTRAPSSSTETDISSCSSSSSSAVGSIVSISTVISISSSSS